MRILRMTANCFFKWCLALTVSVQLVCLPLCRSSYAETPQAGFDKGVALFEEGLRLHDNNSDFRGAIEKWLAAFAIFFKLGQAQMVGGVAGALGNAYNSLGDYKNAANLHEAALAIAEETGDKKSKGVHLGNLGNTYINLGDYAKAANFQLRALEVAEESGDKILKGTVLGYLGSAFHLMGNIRGAIGYYEKALSIFEEIGDNRKIGATLGGLGVAYSTLGDYKKAISLHEKALAISERNRDKKGTGDHLSNLGSDYLQLGDQRKAVDFYEKALRIFEEIGDKKEKGATLGNLGSTYHSMTDYRKALTYHQKAIDVHKEIGIPYDVPEGNVADTLFALDREDEAHAIFKKQDHPIRLGRYHLKKKEYTRASEQFDRFREKHEKSKIAALVLPEWIGLALSHEGLTDYEKAYLWFKKAVDLLEEQRAVLGTSEKEHFLEGKEFEIPRIEAYEGAVRSAFMLGKFDEAFYWAENTRGRLTSELLSSRHSGNNAKIPANLAKEEEELTDKIRQNKKRQQTAFEKNNPELLKQLEAEYPPLKARMDRLIDRLRKEYPQYAAIKYPQPVTLSQLALKPGETIIEYEVTDPYTIGMVIRDGKVVKSFKIDKTRKELEALVKKFRAPFQEGGDIKSFNQNQATELAALILKPALSAVNKGDRLIIIPDESLSLVPFEALPLFPPPAAAAQKLSQKGKQKVTQAKCVVYAMDEYPISYYQSASVLSLQRGLKTRRETDRNFFGLGDPVFDAADSRSAGTRGLKVVAKEFPGDSEEIASNEETKKAGYYFGRLVNTEKEIREVGRLFGNPKLLTGSDATEEKLKGLDLSSKRYLLFSTHGILGNEIPYIKQPALVLNLVGNDKEDGFLTASEIFNMNLNADLVALSACKTGLGVQSAGEGVVGLSRAFMYAGTDTVLVSLWSVADESTYKLMVKFFEGVKGGKDKMSALKDAKNYLRTNGYANPFYWAPFILMGEAN